MESLFAVIRPIIAAVQMVLTLWRDQKLRQQGRLEEQAAILEQSLKALEIAGEIDQRPQPNNRDDILGRL